MKKFITIILALSMVFAMSAFAFDADNNSKLSIPTPDEIESYYQQVSSQAVTLTAESANIMSVLSENSDIENQPLLQLGVLSSFAEDQDDLSILIAASPIIIEEIMPNLTANEYISILSNEKYTSAFKFSIIDMYSYAATSDTTRNTTNFSSVDEKLKDFVFPNNELSIIALTSIQDKSIISCEKLTNLFNNGTVSEQQLSLKVMSEIYPAATRSYIEDILSSENENTVLYRTAINFVPSIVQNSDELTESEALNIIDNILANTNDELVKITCVQALQKLNSAAASAIISSNISTIPVELVEYYNLHSDFDVIFINTNNIAPRSSTNRLANAIYRDGVAVIEYHAGIVAHSQGPEYNSTGKWVIHASGDSSSVVEYAKYKPDFLKDKKPVGEYYMSSMSYSDQLNIFFTAVDLTNNGITYTLLSIFTTNLSSGTISPSDIIKMRCDGVVEYSYEYNGIKVLGGSTNWNCSTVSGLLAHSGTPKSQSQAFNSTY